MRSTKAPGTMHLKHSHDRSSVHKGRTPDEPMTQDAVKLGLYNSAAKTEETKQKKKRKRKAAPSEPLLTLDDVSWLHINSTDVINPDHDIAAPGKYIIKIRDADAAQGQGKLAYIYNPAGKSCGPITPARLLQLQIAFQHTDNATAVCMRNIITPPLNMQLSACSADTTARANTTHRATCDTTGRRQMHT